MGKEHVASTLASARARRVALGKGVNIRCALAQAQMECGSLIHKRRSVAATASVRARLGRACVIKGGMGFDATRKSARTIAPREEPATLSMASACAIQGIMASAVSGTHAQRIVEARALGNVTATVASACVVRDIQVKHVEGAPHATSIPPHSSSGRCFGRAGPNVLMDGS